MSQENPHIPRRLRSYWSGKLDEAYKKQGEKVTWNAIDTLFQIVSEITGLNPDDLLNKLGFDERNQDRYSLQSLLGVTRTIVTLRNLGFTEIIPLPPRQDRKEADLLARRGDELFAVEVFRANEDRWRYPGYNLEEYIGKRFLADKKAQLDATVANYNCSRAILAVVFDSESKALLNKNEIQESAELAFTNMGFPDKTHLLIFTGLADSATGEDDRVVYPDIPPQ